MFAPVPVDDDAAQLASVPHTRRDGRLYIGRFRVPDRLFFLHPPCPACSGPTLHDDGDLKCLLCARELRAVAVSPEGRVAALGLSRPSEMPLLRVGAGQARRNARTASRAEGGNGLQARVLKHVPYGPDRYTVIETLSMTLSTRRELIRSALDALESQRLVERFSFNKGYRVGYRRVPPPGRLETTRLETR